MTSYERSGPRPEIGRFFGFDHVTFWVSNAKQAAGYYTARFGFQPIAYRGLETGSRRLASYVLRNGNVTFVFECALNPDDEELTRHIGRHGDGARVVAFSVEDAAGIWKKAVDRGAVSVQEPKEETDDHGTVVTAAVRTYGDTVHVLVDRTRYNGPFLPGYRDITTADPLVQVTPLPGFSHIDHIVGNQPEGDMEPTAQWYERMLDFHRFWSVDDKQIHTEYSALRSIVMADFDEVVKMPINEPASGRRKSQIQEYVEYYGGAGVQHIAIRVPDIIHAVSILRQRGVQFLSVPATYYSDLRSRLAKSPVQVKEDIDVLEKLQILVDYDDQGYLLQIFTQNMEDRPTFFLEVIQRNNHQGFGAGNFKALFEAIERAQAERGNL